MEQDTLRGPQVCPTWHSGATPGSRSELRGRLIMSKWQAMIMWIITNHHSTTTTGVPQLPQLAMQRASDRRGTHCLPESPAPPPKASSLLSAPRA